MTILITGGTKGIGLAIAERLARPGETLALAYHSDTTAAAAAKERIEAKGAVAHAFRTDVGDIAAAAELMSEVAKLGPGPLHIVHSAATIYPTSLLRADLGRFTAAIRANGLSLLYLVQPALPLLQRGSSIVFISSAGPGRPRLATRRSASARRWPRAWSAIWCPNSRRAACGSTLSPQGW